jgi:5,10-methylenetetrahydrofolate reductase
LIINYELNPPKILPNDYFSYSNLLSDLENVKNKAMILDEYINCLHFTDSVLGIPRLSSITMASIIKKNNAKMKISCSVRTRDRNLTSMYQTISDSILLNIESLLIILGDQPKNDLAIQGLLKPSKVVNQFNTREFNKSIKLNLSIPNKIQNINTIKGKIDAKPNAFVTQSIESIEDLENIIDQIRPFDIKIIACIMIPSEKNKRSAELIGLNWKEYEQEPIEFIKNCGKIADEVLITSPNHFALATEILKELK